MDDRKTILVIDDYETSAAGWGLYLHNAKYSVETAYSPEEGLQLFATPADRFGVIGLRDAGD